MKTIFLAVDVPEDYEKEFELGVKLCPLETNIRSACAEELEFSIIKPFPGSQLEKALKAVIAEPENFCKTFEIDSSFSFGTNDIQATPKTMEQFKTELKCLSHELVSKNEE